MAQQMPNPIELHEGAVEKMLPILSGVSADQLSAATPCTQWNVQSLVLHNIKVAEFVYSLISGTGTPNPMDSMEVSGPLPSDGAEGAFRANTDKVLQAIKAPGAMEKLVDPFGSGQGMPFGNFLMFPMSDIVIHKWDLAKGTNQDTTLDRSLAEACFNVLPHGVEAGRKAGMFGPEVQVPISATIQDKLLGLSGRQP